MSTKPNLTYVNKRFCLIHNFLMITDAIKHAIKTRAVSTYYINITNNDVLIVWGNFNYCTNFYVSISNLHFSLLVERPINPCLNESFNWNVVCWNCFGHPRVDKKHKQINRMVHMSTQWKKDCVKRKKTEKWDTWTWNIES